MPRRRRFAATLLAVPVALAVTSCSTGQAPTATATGSGSTTATPSTSTAATPTPSTTPVEGGGTESAAMPERSDATLERALLELDDLPPGFSIEPQEEGEAGAPVISSKDPDCGPLVKIMNADSAPGSMASATTSFSGGQDGPWIDEYLDAMGSAARVSAFHDKIRTAVKACPKLTMRLPEGRSTMIVRAVRAPDASTDAVAFRVTADGGALDGFEATQVATAIDDVELTMLFFGAFPEEIDEATRAAHVKASELLGAGETTSS
jgi:hypothetical protein